MGWLDDLLKATNGLEPPRQYFFWAGLAALSAVAKRNVWLDRDGAYQLYPNIYVILVGKSGIKKGIPVNIAQKLVDRVNNTRVIHGRSSVQGLIKDMSEQKTRQGGVVLNDSSAFFVSGEFASALVEDPVALTILTDLYDCHYNDEWNSYLKNTPTEQLKNVSLTMLSASNQVHLKKSIPNNAIGGGFVARTFFIVANRRQSVNSLIYKTGRTIDIDELARWLIKISELQGEFIVSPDAADYYNRWYNEFHVSDHEEDTVGISGRLGDHVLKVAMLVSLSHRLDLTIDVPEMDMATKACLILSPNIDKAMVGQPSESDLISQTKVLMEELLAAKEHSITRIRLLQKRWGEINALELDVVAENLKQADFVEIYQENGETAYRLTEFVLSKYKEVKEEV